MGIISKMICEEKYRTKYGNLNWNVEDKDSYYEFHDRAEIKEWGENIYGEWAKRYKVIMGNAAPLVEKSCTTSPLEYYCGYSYRNINQYLRERNGKDDRCDNDAVIADILKIVLCSAPRIPHNLILYRIVNDNFINALIINNKMEQYSPALEKGFMSTSLLQEIVNEKEGYARYKNLLKIYVPQNTVGVYVNAVTKRKEEEMLLLPNMQLGLIRYPYVDYAINKVVYECKLIDFYSFKML